MSPVASALVDFIVARVRLFYDLPRWNPIVHSWRQGSCGRDLFLGYVLSLTRAFAPLTRYKQCWIMPSGTAVWAPSKSLLTGIVLVSFSLTHPWVLSKVRDTVCKLHHARTYVQAFCDGVAWVYVPTEIFCDILSLLFRRVLQSSSAGKLNRVPLSCRDSCYFSIWSLI